MQNGYHQAYAAWKRDPEAFWREAAADIDWFKPPARVFSPEEGVYGRWFSGAETNTCHNCLDRHVTAGRGGEMAVIFDSAMTGEKRRFTYDEVLDEVKAIAATLVDLGIGRGDRVILYMPMVPQAVFSMLACARIGAVHSVVFGGFAASELAARIDDCGAKLVITASCGLEPGRIVAYKPLVDQALTLARSKPERCLVLQRPELRADLVSGRDQDFEAAVAQHRGAEIACVPVKATDPLYILYTSGTTGQPKGVVRDTGAIETSSGIIGTAFNGTYGGTFIVMASIYDLDITGFTQGQLDSALTGVELVLGAMTAAGSALGSISTRIQLQENFVSGLHDSIDSGVGRLVDADMEEESSKLSALQTQQQLAVQSLSIANSSAQNILTLFRS
ncbi:flagellin domain protein [Rhizobium leguminosarum bv. trifolii WSM2304]|uniref:Flagellin domain protein n=2 Tax=Rhizobium leguminosarum TaxID=384 RepID=A0ABF7QSD0_RHILW|nr:flagellin domain protein [Rhizobium leguminosarum bv. trifolii WSM2304]